MTKKKDINDNLKEIFNIIFKTPIKKINRNSNNKNIKKWDSLNHVKLIMTLESKFKISIKPEEAIKLMGFKNIEKFLIKKLSKKS